MEDCKQRILLVGDYNRSDFLYVAKELSGKADFFFIEYLNKKHLTNLECLSYGSVLYWKDFSDAYDLIEKIQPTKILFYFIESYNHVALNVACKVKGIPSFHLEHGLRFPVSYYKMINAGNTSLKEKKILLANLSKLHDVSDKYKNWKFFKNSIARSPQTEREFLKTFYAIRSRNTIFDTFQKLKSPLRLPDSYISFSPKIFNYHKEMEKLPHEFPVKYTGIPYFDKLAKEKEISNSASDILFIDQPLAEQHLFGWTTEYQYRFLDNLAISAAALRKKIYIKPHPWNDRKSYNKISSSENVVILNNNIEEIVSEVNTILGFSSTLLLPLMAMEHTVCFSLEMHPIKLEKEPSFFLTETGAISKIESWEQLANAFKNLDAIFQEQKRNKGKFIEDWLYRFDGRSTERLKNILLSEAS